MAATTRMLLQRAARLMPCAVLLYATTAAGADYPEKPIRVIVPSTGGSSPDIVARIVATEMAKTIGQPVIVENKPGADGIVAYEFVVKQSPPDGYNIALVNVPALAGLPATAKELRFDPLKDMTLLILAAETQYVFASNEALPWKTFRDLIGAAKASPGKLNYGYVGANLRLLTEAIIQDQSLKVVSVPYKAGGPYVQAVVVGEVQMGYLGESSAIGQAKKLHPLAVTGPTRRPNFPDVPTFTELGYPQITGPAFALGVSTSVPKAVAEKITANASRGLKSAEAKQRFANAQFDVLDIGPEGAMSRLMAEARLYSTIAKKAGIEPE